MVTREDIILRRLSGQHLLTAADTKTVIKNLCGVQSQFLSHALHGLSLRCHSVDTSCLVKSWTIRGTMHLFSLDDLPLFLHKGRSHFLRPVDTMETDSHIDAPRKAYFGDIICEAIASGTDEREALKALCESRGMTEGESRSAFDPWGGLIRALCEEGRICHKVQEKKAYMLCPRFEPMDAEAARLELARRYFTYFGPATVKDAAYFFGTTQKSVKEFMSQLPLRETNTDGKSFFYIGGQSLEREIPRCIFLSGFDQMLLGYDKRESLILPGEQLREIFTLAGIVRPALLIDGRVAGWWNLKNRKLQIKLFGECDHGSIEEEAHRLWSDIKAIEFT